MNATERGAGIILRTYPLSETSLIVCWLTAEWGRIDTAAKGARRPKSPLRGKLDLFYEAEFNFARSRRSELHSLREVSLRETHLALRTDLVRLEQVCYCAALVEQTTEKDTPVPAVFDLMRGLLEHLDARPPKPRTVYAFELKLLRELGLEPDLSGRSPGVAAAQLMRELTRLGWTELERLTATAECATQVRHYLHGFLIYHLGRIPHGRAAALGADT